MCGQPLIELACEIVLAALVLVSALALFSN